MSIPSTSPMARRSCGHADCRIARPTPQSALSSTNLQGWCRLGELADISGLGASAFDAFVRLIDEGVLTVRDRARISHDCLVGTADRVLFTH